MPSVNRVKVYAGGHDHILARYVRGQYAALQADADLLIHDLVQTEEAREIFRVGQTRIRPAFQDDLIDAHLERDSHGVDITLHVGESSRMRARAPLIEPMGPQ